MRMFIDGIRDEFSEKLKLIFKNKQLNLENLNSHFMQHSFVKRFQATSESIFYIKSQLSGKQKQLLNDKQKKLDFLKEIFLANHPDKKITKGFVQTTKENKIINIDNCEVGENLNLQTSKFNFDCKIVEKNSNY
jgi:exodeoxyribonuclease VII large subunit